MNVQSSLPDAWRARWIWQPQDGPANTWTAFRYSFDLPAGVERAPLWVACADKYRLWLNGRLVVREGGLKAGPTRQDGYVDCLDVAGYLQAGRNRIAVLVWFFGHDGASHRNGGQGGLLLQMHAGAQIVASGSDWRLLPHPAYGQRGDGLSVTLAEQAVDFDARRDIAGWTDAAFDDAHWDRAVEKGAPPVAPWGALVARPIPFWRDSEPRPYENHAALALPVSGPATVVGKLPANLQVYPRFRVRAAAGAEVKIRIERDRKTTLYTARDGEQEFEVPAWGNGHDVTYELPEGVELIDAGYRETGYDASFAGAFACSDSALTNLRQKAARTGYLCMRDNFMDCPDRERSPWIGDAANTLEVALRALDRRADALIAKTFRELAGWATPEGILWSAVPTSRFAGAFREFPAQTLLALGFGLRSYWLHTGDEALARDFYPAFRRYIFDLWKVENGLVAHRGPWETAWGPGVQCWYDWGSNLDIEALDTPLYYAALDTLGLLARASGESGDAARCRDLQEEMRRAYDAAYWSDADKAYRSARHDGPPDERVQALAADAGLALPERRASLADRIEEVERCSIYLEHLPLQALVRLGRPQSALRRLHRRFDSAIASDYTTLPERFGENSNHAWGGAAICLLAERLLGIEVTEPGFRRARFAPLTDALDWADYTLPTAQGALRLGFRPGNLHLAVPRGTVIETRLPADSPQIAVNGRSWRRAEPCPFADLPMETSADGTWLALGEGEWKIETR